MSTLLIRPPVKYVLKQGSSMLQSPAANGPVGVFPPGITLFNLITLALPAPPAGIKIECPARPIVRGVFSTVGNRAKPFLLPQNPCVKLQTTQALLVMVWLTVPDIFPHASTATHVLVSRRVPPFPKAV